VEYFVSICVTSYNRPTQLRRCLESIKTKYPNEIQVLIGEDRSPKWREIIGIVDSHKRNSNLSITLLVNEENVGYDLNFFNLIQKSSGRYLIFITDDDAFMPDAIDQVIDGLKEQGVPVAFTPYVTRDTGVVSRHYGGCFVIKPGISSVEEHFYNSILLSGLIFKRDAIPNYDASALKGLIYSQVFVFISILYESGGRYLDIPLVDYIGDGGNGFGTNASEEKNALLADRMHYLSNLEYNKRLVTVVNLFDKRYGTALLSSMSKTYALRTIVGLCYARSFGVSAMQEYKNELSKVGFKLGVLPSIYYYCILIFGLNVTRKVLQFGKYIVSNWSRRRFEVFS